MLGLGCAEYSGNSGESFDKYYQEELSEFERQLLIKDIKSVLGTEYTWGGESIEDGFDCSGLIQWAYKKQGFCMFRVQDQVFREVTAHNLWKYNVNAVKSVNNIRRGDFIFFDEEGNGNINHNAVFDKVDDQGNVWVYDAYSVTGAVVHRKVSNFWDKNPFFGRPLKTIK